ncbi:MAG TPA: hypothetical protein DF613_06375 [Lachnospiraceae bacterium]|nr:hypothetical protein [Lachnospiraceae bacterium]
MKLTEYEREMLEGKYGRFKQVALQNVVKYAKVVDAEELVEVTKSTLYFGAHSYLETCKSDDYDKIFAKMYLCTDEDVKIGKFADNCYCQTCVAPCDQYDYEFNHLPKELFERNKRYLKRTLEAGCALAGSCTPYLNGWVPLYGEYVVTSESSNVTMSNSAFGARCNADGEEAITWISICGRAPKWGYYLPENRYADAVFHVDCKSETRFDWDIIGYTVGRLLPNHGVPVLDGNFHRPTLTMLKQCFTAMATTSACEMCHIVGVTPEARTIEEARGNKELRAEYTITQADYEESYRQICSAGSGPVDYVVLGCPHYSLEDVQQAALYIKGKKVAPGVEFSIWTDMSTREMAKESGYLDMIEEAGGRLMSSSCPLVMDPIAFAHVNALVTDAGKQAHYMHSSMDPARHVPIYYGSLEKCIDTACSGYWEEEN